PKGDAGVQVLVTDGGEPVPEQYEADAAPCRRGPGSTFRRGKVFGSPCGEPTHRYLAEWEFPDEDAFKTATTSEEFAATGTDARDRKLPRPTVEFVNLS